MKVTKQGEMPSGEWIGQQAKCDICGTEADMDSSDSPVDVKSSGIGNGTLFISTKTYVFSCPGCSNDSLKLSVTKTI